MKKHLVLVVSMLVFAFSFVTVSSDIIEARYSTVKVYINGTQIEGSPVVVDGKVYIPLDETVDLLQLTRVEDIEARALKLSTFPSVSKKYLYIVADNKESTYLGKLSTNKYDKESIYNKYGDYGSEYKKTCIWNQYGDFGGEYSKYSPYNKYTSNSPKIYDSTGKYVGRLTVNEITTDAINPDTLYKYLIDLGY